MVAKRTLRRNLSRLAGGVFGLLLILGFAWFVRTMMVGKTAKPWRQVQVTDDHINRFLLQELKGIRAASRLQHVIVRIECPKESAANRLVVVYHKDGFFESSFSGLIWFTHLVEFPGLPLAISTTLNVVPTPSCEATVIDPPLATTTSRQV